MKDLIRICLESDAQSCGITFEMCYVGSKYPYFISYRGKWVNLFCRGCSTKQSSSSPIKPFNRLWKNPNLETRKILDDPKTGLVLNVDVLMFCIKEHCKNLLSSTEKTCFDASKSQELYYQHHILKLLH